MKNIFLIFLIGISQLSFAQEFSTEEKQIAKQGLDCLDAENYVCGVEKFEKLLKFNLTAKQKTATYGILISSYYSLCESAGDVNLQFKYNCLRGIELCDKNKESNSADAVVFHYYMVVYYCFNDDKSKMNVWIDKLNNVKANCTASFELKKELNNWTNHNVKLMKNSFNSSSTTISFNLGSLFGNSNSSSGNQSVKKVERKKEKLSSPSTSGLYSYINEYNHSDHIEYTYRCTSGKYFVVRQFKKSGRIYSSSGSEYNSITEAANKWAKINWN
ncbi:MAG: hypothetical protein GQ527_05620 [Bacteroidales bacterium]|nr:hypothetical protein [Bacteroidales bacterium]